MNPTSITIGMVITKSAIGNNQQPSVNDATSNTCQLMQGSVVTASAVSNRQYPFILNAASRAPGRVRAKRTIADLNPAGVVDSATGGAGEVAIGSANAYLHHSCVVDRATVATVRWGLAVIAPEDAVLNREGTIAGIKNS